jgi:RNA polymerase sigma-70 factor (ECF subfamily)
LLLELRCGAHPTARQAALSQLCQIYWRPIFMFIHASGYDAYDSQDLTQRFMIYFIARNQFAKADKTKGRLRSYILGTLKHFLAHAWRDERTQKRSGGAGTVPLDEAIASEIETPETRGRHPAPPHSIDLPWALALRQRLDDRIAAEYAAAKKSKIYRTLQRHLTGEKSPGRYKDDARRLGRPVATVRSDVARMRIRYSELLVEELARSDPDADVMQEVLYYFRVISGCG